MLLIPISLHYNEILMMLEPNKYNESEIKIYLFAQPPKIVYNDFVCCLPYLIAILAFGFLNLGN